MKWTWMFSLFGRTFMFKMQTVPKPVLETRGIASNIPHTPFHVLFMDYDYVDLGFLREELEALIEIFSLGNCYIIQTKENAFHVDCLDYLTAREIVEIGEMSNEDRAYIRGPLFNKHRGWVHRTEAKGKQKAPVFVEVIESPYDGESLQSSHHAELLNRRFGLDIKLSNPDGLNKGIEDSYLTTIKKK